MVPLSEDTETPLLIFNPSLPQIQITINIKSEFNSISGSIFVRISKDDYFRVETISGIFGRLAGFTISYKFK